MSPASPEYKKINLIPFPDGSSRNHPQGADELDDPESLKSRFDSFLNGGNKEEEDKVVPIKEYKDLSNIPKPTNLDIETIDKTSSSPEGTKEEESSEDFEVPKGFRTYVMDLKAQKRKTSVLEWDMRPPASKERIISSLKRSLALNDFSEAEYNTAIAKLESLSEKSDVPSAIDIAMRVTDKYVEKKGDEGAEVKKPETEVVPEEVIAPDSSIENAEEKLEEARKNFVVQVMSWEKQKAENRRTFKKLISSLGTDREAPEQEEPVDLVEAREVYKEAKKEKYKPFLEKGVVEMRQVEGQILPLREIKYETNVKLSEEIEVEQNKLRETFESNLTEPERELAVRGLEKFGKVSRIARLMLSDMLASGTALVFGQRAGEIARAYSGYRMERAVGSIAQKVDGIQKKNIENIHTDAIEELKTNIDEENLLERESRFMDVLEKEKNLNKKRRLISAGLSAITGTKKIETPETEKAPENTAESSENTAFVFNGKEIAHEKDGILVLDDDFQDGSENKEARIAFSEAFDEKYKESLLGITPIAIKFEEGRIYVTHTNEGIRVFLNGKEIARGKDRKSVELMKGIEKGWFLNSVYQRALEHAAPVIKTIK